ncbi:cell division protein FtsW [Janthinobacterium sp. CG_23.3]|uniref:FtsW/RodA/SpoVE family cell cycle protein n=1 Tax=Janthinobacterium sp. CG_23.3 TaxID=3349634 RepID=UPI0038D48EF0
MIALRPTPRAATACALALLLLLQAWSLWRAPDAWFPARITVSLDAGGSVALGRHELAAAQADHNHIALRRDGAGAWWLRNLSAAKQVVLHSAAGERRMGSASLAARQAFQIGAARFEVEDADAASVGFARDGHHWRYDGAVLYRDGQAQAPCADARLGARALALWNRALPAILTIGRPLTFGGNVHCANRLGLADVTPGAAWLARIDGRLQLAAGNPDGERAALTLSAHGLDTDLRRQELPLDGVQAIVVGHTRFQLGAADGQLQLLPSRRVTLFSAPGLQLPPSLTWQWQRRALWSGAAATPLWCALALALAALLAATLRPQPPARSWRADALACAAVLLGGVAALALQRAGHAPAAAQSMALAGAALWLWLALPGRLTLAGAAAVLLLAAGLLAQLELGLGGMETSWLRYYQKSAALLAIGAGLGGAWRLCGPRRTGVPSQRGVEAVLAALAALALLALAMQVLWGDETGVFDLQPVELAKLALTALSAHCLALRLGWHGDDHHRDSRAARWLRLIAPALLFLALLGVALVQVDDYSPLILLLVWGTAMAFAYALAARNRALAAALALLVLLAAGAIAGMHGGADPGEAAPAGDFYADRFQAWLAPALHPHTGQQLLLGARAIGDGGWWGADAKLGLAGLGQGAGAALLIPAVQDDFAPAFFLNRHGLVGALLLWALQAAFIVGLLRTALRGHAAGAAARDHRHAWLGRFRYFTLCGGAAFVLGHLLLSWGTNLAILPIMGQPMSFLSAGGSHLLFFLCPLLAFSAASALSLEENPSCRSTSSTKS